MQPGIRGRSLGRALGAGIALSVVSACGSSSPSSSTSPPATTPAATRANFVVIIVDDMAHDLYGPGHRFPFFAMPNLDRLASRGVIFDRAFVTTSLCSPSRASMLSGLYTHSHGIYTNQSGDIPTSIVTYPMVLQQAGYRTAFVGKWHMDSTTDAPRPGFDYWVSFKGQGVYEDPVMNENGTEVKRTGYITDLLTDYAVNWLKTGRSSNPFLLILSHKAPHEPFHPAPRHVGAFADAALPEPTSFQDPYLDKPPWQRRYAMCGGTTADLSHCPDPPPPMLPPWGWPAHDATRLDYLRTLLAVDDGVGTVVSTLDGLGLTQSTYVLFISDNGMFLGEHRLGDKRLMYEDSIRVPLLIAGGGAVPERSSSLVLNIDLAPTILQLAGAPVPGGMQGRSLAGLVRHEATSVRDSFLYEYFTDSLIPGVPPMLGVRTASWTYVTYPGLAQGDELYDLGRDPDELTNLADVAAQAGTRSEMRGQLERLLASTGGPPL